jgi:predicted amidohydrolase
VAYHKVWLGAAESNRFTAGDERTVLQVNGRRLGLAICKDTSIPQQHASDTAALGIDAHVAGTGVRGRRRHPG